MHPAVEVYLNTIFFEGLGSRPSPLSFSGGSGTLALLVHVFLDEFFGTLASLGPENLIHSIVA